MKKSLNAFSIGVSFETYVSDLIVADSDNTLTLIKK